MEPSASASSDVGYLESHLYLAASEEGRRALNAFGASDNRSIREASLSVGMSAEYLVSAVLTRLNPTLIAEARSAESMVMLADATSHPIGLDPVALRTASMDEKTRRLQHAHPQLTVQSDLRLLMALRNAAAHAALANGPRLSEAMVVLVRVVDALHTVLPHRPLINFWGLRLSKVADEMRDASSSAIQQRVAAKVAAALLQFGLLTEGLNAADRERALLVLQRRARPDHTNAEERPWPCPACKSCGTLAYYKDRSEHPTFETQLDENGVAENVLALFQVVGIPVHFECPVCGLDLSSEELAAFPPMDESVDLDDLARQLSDAPRSPTSHSSFGPSQPLLRGMRPLGAASNRRASTPAADGGRSAVCCRALAWDWSGARPCMGALARADQARRRTPCRRPGTGNRRQGHRRRGSARPD